MANQQELTPTLITYQKQIIEYIQKENTMQVNKAGRAEEALYSKAIVYGQPINVLIDSEAVGCIISKCYLDQVEKEIDALTNIKIIDVTGKKIAPLGMIRQVQIQMQDIKIYIDLI